MRIRTGMEARAFYFVRVDREKKAGLLRHAGFFNWDIFLSLIFFLATFATSY